MKLKSSTNRLIAAMLLIFLIGFLFVNAHSSSHGQLSHRHQSDIGNGQHVAGNHDAGHRHDDGHDDGPGVKPASTEHTHPHNPLDHTHDIPLRMTMTITTEPSFFRGWLARAPLPLHTTFLIPLERPPKSPSTA